MTHFLINGYNHNIKRNFYKFFLNDKTFKDFINKEIYDKNMNVKALHNVKATNTVKFSLKNTTNDYYLNVTINDSILDIKRAIKEMLGNGIALNKINITNGMTEKVLANYKMLVDEGKLHVYINLGANSINFDIDSNFKIN